jgi:hypothetical protein
VTELIVELPLLIVAEDLERFGALLEVLLGLGVAGVPIGVELHRLLAIGPLDVGRGGVARDPKNFIIIPFGGHRAGS